MDLDRSLGILICYHLRLDDDDDGRDVDCDSETKAVRLAPG
jgi:hypothetical protein